ncbi:MAG: DUF1993 family protein [Aquabacterium sp.]
MSEPMYEHSVPVLQRQLGCLLDFMDKAEAHAKARGFDVNLFLQTRLTPDMLPFVSQVRIASDAAKGCVARLTGVDNPVFEDNEATMDDCRARVRRTLDFIGSVKADAFAGSAQRTITIPLRNREPVVFNGENFLRHWALPNFFFHVTTAYALLRHGGVPLGKGDFLGGN